MLSTERAQRAKRTYVTPQVVVHGTVEEITAGCDKTLGLQDGFTFQGQSIVCKTS
jgi:hypothetical protein